MLISLNVSRYSTDNSKNHTVKSELISCAEQSHATGFKCDD